MKVGCLLNRLQIYANASCDAVAHDVIISHDGDEAKLIVASPGDSASVVMMDDE